MQSSRPPAAAAYFRHGVSQQPRASGTADCRPKTREIRCRSNCVNADCVVEYGHGCRIRVQIAPRFESFSDQWTFLPVNRRCPTRHSTRLACYANVSRARIRLGTLGQCMFSQLPRSCRAVTLKHTTFRNAVAHSPLAISAHSDASFRINGILDITPENPVNLGNLVSLEEFKGRGNESAVIARDLPGMQADHVAHGG